MPEAAEWEPVDDPAESVWSGLRPIVDLFVVDVLAVGDVPLEWEDVAE